MTKDTYIFYRYNDTSCRICNIKYKKIEKKEKNYYIPQYDDEETQRVSLSRTRRHIRELALCNNFEYFATLTISSEKCDRFSLTECQDLLKKKLKKLKRKNNNFAYIFITEKHKNGAFHFHGLIKGVDDFYINDNGYLSHSVFDEIGFNSFSLIKDYNKTCNYILKYITKDCVKNENNQIYIRSRGLKLAESYEIYPISFDWSYSNDFCNIRDFTFDELSTFELLQFYNISEKNLTIFSFFYNIYSDLVKLLDKYKTY